MRLHHIDGVARGPGMKRKRPRLKIACGLLTRPITPQRTSDGWPSKRLRNFWPSMAHQSQSQKPMGQPMIGAGGVLLNLAYALIATRSSEPTISSGSAIGAGTVG